MIEREIPTTIIVPQEPFSVAEERERSRREKVIDKSLEAFRRVLGTGTINAAAWGVFLPLTLALGTLGKTSGFFEDMDTKKVSAAIFLSGAANIISMRPRVKRDVKKSLKDDDLSTTFSSAAFKTAFGESSEENGAKDRMNVIFSTLSPTIITSPLILASFESSTALAGLVAANVSGTIANTAIVMRGSGITTKGSELMSIFNIRRNRE